MDTLVSDGVRCASWTSASGIDPIGSAGTYERVILVELPLPWPHDIGKLPAIAEIGPVPQNVRILGVVPERPNSSDRLVTVWSKQATHRYSGIDLHLPAAGLGRHIRTLIDEGPPDWADVPAPDDVLLCTHGGRDRCCGSLGTVLHAQVAGRWPGVRVRRCSHTGGHRFAPTGLTFPAGRGWAFLDRTLLDAIVERRGNALPSARHDRGAIGLPTWAQPVDRAMLIRSGWEWLDVEFTGVHIQVAPDGRSASVALRWPGGGSTAEVIVAREVPVPICGEPIEAATKSTPELAIASLKITTS